MSSLKQVITVNEKRSAAAFPSDKEKRKYWVLLTILVVLGVFFSIGLLVYNNPVAIDSPSFIPVVRRRLVAVIAMIIAAVCHSLSTVAFQTITNNRVITPSLLGFESLYTVIQTSTIFFFGANALINFSGTQAFLFQVGLMIIMSLILYGSLLAGKYGNLHLMLLVGIVIGTGLRSVSTFMRRLLAPSEFDILQARLFASVNNADASYFPIAIPIVVIVAILLIANSRKLNVLSLGKDVANTLGVDHKKNTLIILVLISVLMSISTALVGPLTFYAFLITALAYQAVPTYDHKYVFPMAIAIGVVIMTAAYFIMNHLFAAQGVVSIIIELVGGIVFIVLLLRKGSL